MTTSKKSEQKLMSEYLYHTYVGMEDAQTDRAYFIDHH